MQPDSASESGSSGSGTENYAARRCSELLTGGSDLLRAEEFVGEGSRALIRQIEWSGPVADIQRSISSAIRFTDLIAAISVREFSPP